MKKVDRSGEADINVNNSDRESAYDINEKNSELLDIDLETAVIPEKESDGFE